MKKITWIVAACMLCGMGLFTSCEAISKAKDFFNKAQEVKENVEDAVDTYNDVRDTYESLTGDNDEQDVDDEETSLIDADADQHITADPNASGSEFLYLSQRLLTEQDLAGWSKQDMRTIRNAIYARHGYKFKSADLREYFSRFSWYKPLYDNVESQLNSIEKKNVAFIKAHE